MCEAVSAAGVRWPRDCETSLQPRDLAPKYRRKFYFIAPAVVRVSPNEIVCCVCLIIFFLFLLLLLLKPFEKPKKEKINNLNG